MKSAFTLAALATLLLNAFPAYSQAGPNSRRMPLKAMDKNRDGKISRSEFRGPTRAFGQLDSNHDGFISADEIKQMMQRQQQNQQQSREKQAAVNRQTPSPQRQDKTVAGIDTHNHPDVFLRQEGKRPNANKRYHRKAAAELIALMDRHGVEKSMICVVRSHLEKQSQKDEDNYFKVASYEPNRIFVMAGGGVLQDLIEKYPAEYVSGRERKEFKEKAEGLLKRGAKGFGEMLAMHLSMQPKHNYFRAEPDHPLFLFLADLAAEHDVPIDIHMEAIPEDMQTPANLVKASPKNPKKLKATIPAFERLLAHNPKAKIVWQHLGWDNTGYRTPQLTRKLLKKYPNLYLAIRVERRPVQVGSHTPMPNRLIDGNWKLKKEWLQLFQEFPDRFMIGADEFVRPNDAATGGIGCPSFIETWAVMDQLPEPLAKKIGRDNAKKLYHLE